MGVLRYFPGSEPADRASAEPAAGAADSAAPHAAPTATSAPDPGWAVPVLGLGETQVAETQVGGGGMSEPSTGDTHTARSSTAARAERRAENVSMATLARHDTTEAELTATLQSRGLDDDAVAAEVQRLKGVGLIDDTAFAERLVARLRERRGLGDSGVRSALRQRRVPADVVEAVLAVDDDAADDRLQQVAASRARQLANLPADVAERRLSAFLMRRGYGGSQMRDVVRAALADAGGQRR